MLQTTPTDMEVAAVVHWTCRLVHRISWK